MAGNRDTVLVIDPDPNVRSLLAEGILEASGQFATLQAADGMEGMSVATSYVPDLIILELDMPGLSGKDLMVALSSQGYDMPVIVTTQQGNEALAVEAFRLGAKDFLTKPYREAEVVSAVERVLTEVHWRRERDQMTESLQMVNQELEHRLEEQRTLFAIGKSVTSMTNLEQLFNLVVEAAVYLTNAQMSGAMLRDDRGGSLILHAGTKLPPHLAQQIKQPVNDNLAALVMTSGEPLLASGEGLRRFNPPHNAHSVIYVPLVVAEQTVGVLWVGNQYPQGEFVNHQKDLLFALADYAAIAVVNARLFQVMEQRAQRLEQFNVQLQEQQSGGGNLEQVIELSNAMRAPLEEIRRDLSLLRSNEHKLHPQNEASLDVLDRKLREMLTFLNEAVRHTDQPDPQQ